MAPFALFPLIALFWKAPSPPVIQPIATTEKEIAFLMPEPSPVEKREAPFVCVVTKPGQFRTPPQTVGTQPPPIWVPPQPCRREFYPVIPALQYRVGSGRSYRHGYGTIRTFAAAYTSPEIWYPFVDLRLHRYDCGRIASNLGVGFRGFACDEMYGVNLFYDYRGWSRGSFHQIGVGGELFLRCWELRVNGYIPFGRKTVFHDSTLFTFSGGYEALRNRFQRAVWGIDLEVGRPLWRKGCVSFFGAIGPYYYDKEFGGLVGGMTRLCADIGNCFAAALYFTYDKDFYGRLQGEFTLHLPLGRCFDCVRDLFMPIFRNDIILIETHCNFKTNF